MTTNDISEWKGREAPDMPVTMGRHVAITPFDAAGASDDLFALIGGPHNDDLWRYIPLGPFDDAAALLSALVFAGAALGWRVHIIRDAATNAPLGMASFLRIRPEHGSAEIGCIVFSKKLQRTAHATEAMYLMARYLFETLGYRRYEWKCHNANAASKRAATRLGFTFEGVFRQDMVVKGESRDTAWFSLLDGEWPMVKAGFEAWLDPANFGPDGRQRRSLADCRREPPMTASEVAAQNAPR